MLVPYRYTFTEWTEYEYIDEEDLAQPDFYADQFYPTGGLQVSAFHGPKVRKPWDQGPMASGYMHMNLSGIRLLSGVSPSEFLHRLLSYDICAQNNFQICQIGCSLVVPYCKCDVWQLCQLHVRGSCRLWMHSCRFSGLVASSQI